MAISTKRIAPSLSPDAPGTMSRSVSRYRWAGLFGSGDKIRTKDIIFFSSQLSLMLEIGTSLVDSLRAIRDQTKNSSFRKVLQAVSVDLQEGRQLSDAMKRHDHVFNNIFISMVKAGETGGFLKKILDSLVEMQEKRQALIAQLKSTLTYPAALCALGLVVVIFVLVGILPRFMTLFEGKESILPLTTRVMMGLSTSLRAHWWLYLVATAGLGVGFSLWRKSEGGRAMLDRFFVSAPIVSALSNKIYTCQFLRTLGHLMQSQVPLLEALEVTRATFGNRHYLSFVDRIMEHVEQGGRFSQPFAGNPYILESVKQMVATGEETGKLPTVMLRLAEYYDAEADRNLKAFAAMIEPVALIVLGTLVGILAGSVILPLFKVAHAIR
jgi:type IV pilus assembly protein PilC